MFRIDRIRSKYLIFEFYKFLLFLDASSHIWKLCRASRKLLSSNYQVFRYILVQTYHINFLNLNDKQDMLKIIYNVAIGKAISIGEVNTIYRENVLKRLNFLLDLYSEE